MTESSKQLAKVLDHIVAAVEGMGPLIANEELGIEQRGALVTERARMEVNGMRLAKLLEQLEPPPATTTATPAGGPR